MMERKTVLLDRENLKVEIKAEIDVKSPQKELIENHTMIENEKNNLWHEEIKQTATPSKILT